MLSASATRTLSGRQKGHWERSKRLLKTLKKKKKKNLVLLGHELASKIAQFQVGLRKFLL